MRRGSLISSRVLVGVLAAILAVTASATCVAAALQAPESQPHGCCTGMSQVCGDSMTTQADCCAIQNADLARLGGAAQSVADGPPAVTDSAIAEPMRFTAPSTVAAFEPGGPKSSSSPTYLLVSVFRI